MNLTAIHLIPILIAFAAFVFWMKGNFQKNKTLVAIGVALTIIGFILLYLEESSVIGPIIL